MTMVGLEAASSDPGIGGLELEPHPPCLGTNNPRALREEPTYMYMNMSSMTCRRVFRCLSTELEARATFVLVAALLSRV